MSSYGVVLTLVARVPGGVVLTECTSCPPDLTPVPTQRDKKRDDGSADDAFAAAFEAHRVSALRVLAILTNESRAKLDVAAPSGLCGRRVNYICVHRRGVAVLAVTAPPHGLQKDAVFGYVEAVLSAFCERYDSDAVAVAGSYGCIDFETEIGELLNNAYVSSGYNGGEKAETQRMDGILDQVTSELNDARRTITESMQELVERGEKLSSVNERSDLLVSETSKYSKSAKEFERKIWLQQKMPVIVVSAVVVIFIVLRLFVF